MKKIPYETEDFFCITPCPCKEGKDLTVGSYGCQRCEFNKGTFHQEQYVECIADEATEQEQEQEQEQEETPEAISKETPYVLDIAQNFYQLYVLNSILDDIEHTGFIAGGCFKHILSGDKVKDVDVFFHEQGSFERACRLLASKCSEEPAEGETFYDRITSNKKYEEVYENDKCVCFKRKSDGLRIELIRSIYGTHEDILDAFDFTVVKMAYYSKWDDMSDKYKFYVKHHPSFFKHLFMKRLVLDKNVPFPVSTWERTYRYAKYGFYLCRESKKRLLDEIRDTNDTDLSNEFYSEGRD